MKTKEEVFCEHLGEYVPCEHKNVVLTYVESNIIMKAMESYASQVLEDYKKGQWISVTEKLPEQGQIVLAIGNGRYASMCQYSGNFDRYVEYVEGDRLMAVYFDEIKFWMPLPSPPKTN